MFRQASKIALVVTLALVSHTLATAQETKEAGARAKSPPKELTVELGQGVKLEMLLIPAGEFLMGAPAAEKNARDDEKPQHRVSITRPFYLGKYLVTQQQWQAVMGNNPSKFKGPQNPVDSVGWDDCRDFLKKLNEKFAGTPVTFALPTEAHWEYACRAGSRTKYFFGDEESRLAEFAWFYDNAGEKTHAVGEKKPNAWGLYDIHGNLFQWCADWYGGDYYQSSPASDPSGPSSGSLHVNRGGGWFSLARGCSSAFRHTNSPRPDHFIGLRLMGTTTVRAEPPLGAAPKADNAPAAKPGAHASAQRPANWAQPRQVAGLPNLHKVSQDLYRCAQPTAEGFKNRSLLGIKTVVGNWGRSPASGSPRRPAACRESKGGSGAPAAGLYGAYSAYPTRGTSAGSRTAPGTGPSRPDSRDFRDFAGW